MRPFSQSVQTPEELYKEFNSGKFGLNTNQILYNQKKYGLNEISGHRIFWWHILLRQFKSPFLYLLIASAVLSYILGEIIDAVMIALFVSINTTLGFYQEYHSEQTLTVLKKFIVPEVKVIRNNEDVSVKSVDIVPGDIIQFEAGDILPCDIRLFEETNLTVDESVLTGESVPSCKTASVLDTLPKNVYESSNICFSGTTVVSGKGKGMVVRTGKHSSLGEITNLTVETHHESSFEKSVSKFSRLLLYLILITLVGIFILNLFIKKETINIPDTLIFSIALAVSVIPEALPVVITFSLSRGALRLARNKVIVKRLSAIEDLGSIEVLATDKTGTLTENKLTLHNIYGDEKTLLYASLAATLLEKKIQSTHSFDITLLNSLSESEKKEFGKYQRLQENPFDPERKRSSMIIKNNNNYELIVRGATEEILKICTGIREERKKEIEEFIKKESGNRIIAVSRKNILFKESTDQTKEEKDLQFLGLISFVDPIKKTAQKAVNDAKMLGIEIKVLTGDSPEVAGSVGYQIGLIPNPTNVITGSEFESLTSESQHEAVYKYNIFARVSPEQKYKIIQLLEEKHEVGFLGEGINDAPALKIANVAIVVASATDVARESADVVLLKKSLGVIIDGIKEGRETFANTSKYIRATLSSNFGNFYTVAVASLFINYLPLLPLQILLINLLTDFPMIAVATDHVDPAELKSPRSYDIKEIALIGTLLGVVSSIFDFIFFALFYTISPQVLQTNWFIGSVLTELLFLFSIRTRLSIFKAKPPSLILVILTGLAFLTAIILPYTLLGRTLFSFVPPTPNYLITILAVVLIYFVVTEIIKVLYYQSNRIHIHKQKEMLKSREIIADDIIFRNT
ncbi:magnesium-translocating P-type ATPase [Candidatus Gottesmanbacteria bacterium RIFCSPHIGHO2_02_FULL_39_11]|uniref:Magnesium-transporting ATPase, P-type 1 n=1 Tax=Candidatus Gottesmanbacteria bacterium RIFCSPHIGHO2_02_FULL_39_11 TaxID=1798382 RepID=A0A1F5ZW69_9BACT|nr:MAG: magnesium-translocating P-type ATPase [Candidatus Gottesmanbacteria bacterium RIFCSPHIGHO2_02_FULL_39_11]